MKIYYYIYQVPGQLKSEVLETEETIQEVSERINPDSYGLREVSWREYRKEVNYNNSSGNPWNQE